MTRVAVVYHSAYGHTKAQAEAVARGARGIPGVEAELIPVEDADGRWAELDTADAIVFGAPTYMGSVSAPFKAFMDASSKVWMRSGWKDKVGAGFTNSGSQSGDKLATLIQLAIFGMQHQMVWTGLDLMPGNNSSKGSADDLNRLGSWIGAMAQSNVDQGVEGMRTSDLDTAARLGARVAGIARRLREARPVEALAA